MCNARALLYFVLARLRTINPYPNRLPHGHYSIHTSKVTLENICLVQDCCKSSALTIEYCFFALSHRCAYVGCPPTWEKVMRNRALFFISCVLSDTFLRKCNSTIWSKWTVHKPRSYISMLYFCPVLLWMNWCSHMVHAKHSATFIFTDEISHSVN